MSKDPAFLWYWADWAGGTSTFNRPLKGGYMDLLNAQWNSGKLSLDEIKTVLGSDFGVMWPALQKKFERDESGLYCNPRMELEKEKRKSFSESRRQNVKKRYTSSTSVVTTKVHMEDENVNENAIKNKKEFKDCEDCSGKGYTPLGRPCNHRRNVPRETVNYES